jgi:hypothetical protein
MVSVLYLGVIVDHRVFYKYLSMNQALTAQNMEKEKAL